MPSAEGKVKIDTGSDFVEAPYFKPSDIDRAYWRLYDGDDISAFELVDPSDADVPLRIIGPNGNIWGIRSTVISFTYGFEEGHLGEWDISENFGDASITNDSKSGNYAMYLEVEGESISDLIPAFVSATHDKNNWSLAVGAGDQFSFWFRIESLRDRFFCEATNSSSGDNFIFEYNGNLRLEHQDSNGNEYASSSSSISTLDNSWYKMVFNYNPGDHSLSIENTSGNTLASTSVSTNKGGKTIDKTAFGIVDNGYFAHSYAWVDDLVVK